jgi:sarcosine oxidase
MIVGVRADHRGLVVGGGLLGLCAAGALAQRGWSVEVLEAGPGIGHAWAGSKGEARIFRLGYPEAAYVDMAMRAAERWRRLEEATGRALLVPTGQLSLGDRSSLTAVAAALAAHQVHYEEWSAREARERVPSIACGGPVLFEPSSGVLVADECLRALCDVGRFSVRAGVVVTAIHDDAGTVRVRTARGEELRADIVVDCAGPAALGLLPGATAAGGAAGPGPSVPQVAYFRAGTPEELPPVFIEWGDDMVYGLPVPTSDRLYKVSHHTPGPLLPTYDPTGTGTVPDDPTLLATLRHAVGRLLPSLDPEPVRTERCVYDNTADTHFVLDRRGNVVVGCGTSGHGFKFGPVLGEVLADLAEGLVPSVDVSRFRLDRLERLRPPPAR